MRHPAVRRALVLAPHPDDEAIGAAGLILSLRLRCGRVHVAIVSDGAASHPTSRAWPRARLVAERRRETRRVAFRMGVKTGEISHLGLPDGRLAVREPECRRVVRRLLARIGPLDLVVVPDPDDAHPDHRVVAGAAIAARRHGAILGYRVWPGASRGGPARFVRVRGGAAAKRSLIRGYRTQLGAIRDDPAGFTIARHELDRFSRGVERFAVIRG